MANPIHRDPQGSIDFDFYRGQAASERRAARARAMQGFWRACRRRIAAAVARLTLPAPLPRFDDQALQRR